MGSTGGRTAAAPERGGGGETLVWGEGPDVFYE